MVEDSLVSSHPVYQPVNDPAEISALFDRITYSKVRAPPVTITVLRFHSFVYSEYRPSLQRQANVYGRTIAATMKVCHSAPLFSRALP